MAKVLRLAHQRLGQVIDRAVRDPAIGDPKGAPDRFDGFGARAFIQRDADLGRAHLTQVDAFFAR